MKLRFYPTKLSGAVTPPPSKSILHRVLIASALAGEPVRDDPAFCDDVHATVRALRALAAGERADCGESGTTLRLLLPLVMLRGGRLSAAPSLRARPLPPYADAEWQGEDLVIRNRLSAGKFDLSGAVSSQFISGLLFALPLCGGDSEIRMLPPPVSADYITMTCAVLQACGIVIGDTANGFFIPGGQHYEPSGYPVEGDWSAASVFCVANALGSHVKLFGLRRPSIQGDSVIEHYAASLPDKIDVAQIPDLAPALALLATQIPQSTVLSGTDRLRYKESDRVSSIDALLSALGANVTVGNDTVTVNGGHPLRGGEADSFGDHRIAMTAAIAATCSIAPVTLTGAECVRKSYPTFYDDLRSLGMRIEEVD